MFEFLGVISACTALGLYLPNSKHLLVGQQRTHLCAGFDPQPYVDELTVDNGELVADMGSIMLSYWLTMVNYRCISG